MDDQMMKKNDFILNDSKLEITAGNRALSRSSSYLKISPRSREDENGVAVDEFGEDADCVVEFGLISDVVSGEVVATENLARISRPDRHAEITQLGALKTRHNVLQRLRQGKS